ncbi:MAG: hypothetical protein AAB431_01105 [Patescibacteria group bacterium]
MSGAFGWIRNNDSNGAGTQHTNTGFVDAIQPYQHPQPGAPRVTHIGRSQTPPPAQPPPRASFAQAAASVIARLPIPTALHMLKSTAANVLILATDVTGSMGENPKEIFARLPLLYELACQYLGSRDTEILFICFGDARTDTHAVQVAHFGRGPELDPMLTSFSLSCGGGGQGSETPELVAYYLLTQVDTSSARNVYSWFLTDEAGCDTLRSDLVQEWLGLTLNPAFTQAVDVFTALSRRMNVMTLLFDTGAYRSEPRKHQRIRPYWEEVLRSKEAIVPMEDPRRIVDVLLGTIAVMTGQLDLFTSHLQSRQLPTAHGAANVQAVLKSIALLGAGSVSTPTGPGTKSLLPDD